MTAEHSDDVLSDGSGHRSDGILDTTRLVVPVNAGNDLPTLLSAIAALARGQAIVLEKLSFLEMIVGTVQFDMMWVRDDIKLVHQAMDRFGDYVCDVQEEVAEVQKLKEQVSLDGSAGHAMKGKEHVVEFQRPPSASTSHGEHVDVRTDYVGIGGCRKEGGSIIEDTLNLGNIHEPQTNALPVTGRREWGLEYNVLEEFASPQCQQTMVSIEKEPLEDESQQIEMSCQSTQLPTIVAARSMWTDFTTSVKDWRAPPAVPIEREEGWVSAKKGRWDLVDYGKQTIEPAASKMVSDNVVLNLNSPNESQVAAYETRMRGDAALSVAILATSKSGGNGTWRGSARGRRPPAVQPRYHTSVRHLLNPLQQSCEVML